MHKTTLEQWALLDKVIEAGSFASAAQATCRSQSAVSYNLAQLQERLGVALLRPQGRRAVLTPAGEQLLARVRPLLNAFYYVEAQAALLTTGVRTRLELVVDAIFPRGRLFSILRQFQQQHPHTQVNLTEVLESTVAENPGADVMVLTRRQDLTGRGEWLMNIDFVAVAHCDHPLHQQPAPLNGTDLAAWPLIRIAGREDSAQANLFETGECWTFSTIDAAAEAVMAQVGYGWLPEERIAAPLAAGTLKILPMTHGGRRATPLHLIVKDLSSDDRQIQTLARLFNTPE
ncbi:LysR family transcriptional regulator [Erwinia sp.]|uniref:LysR family transcriptional regulator n=1 Tax=Erwinia citreus TaxID=558 RepID=UPI002897A440|nr:LysR family transcriptional regulator [Erwinia sp.]